MISQTERLTLPPMIDVHVHLREPGKNKAETIDSGTYALMMGGIALIGDMPNNQPLPTWTAAAAQDKHARIRARAWIPVTTAAGAQPESDNIGQFPRLSPLSMFLKSYMGKTTGNERGYEAEDFTDIWSAWHDVDPLNPIFVHRGEADLEAIIGHVAQDLSHPLHICHVNDPEEVKLVQKARQKGLMVTSGVTPHHIFMTSNDTHTRGKFAEMMPPLAHQTDVEQLRHMLFEGQIDIVESDHAPHTKEAKMQAELSDGDCFGVAGGEFTMPLLLREFKKGNLSYQRLVEATSRIPAAILGVKLSPKTRATWVLEDYRLERETHGKVKTGAKVNPFLGMMATGRLIDLWVGGKLLVDSSTRPTGVRASRVIKEQGQII